MLALDGGGGGQGHENGAVVLLNSLSYYLTTRTHKHCSRTEHLQDGLSPGPEALEGGGVCGECAAPPFALTCQGAKKTTVFITKLSRNCSSQPGKDSGSGEQRRKGRQSRGKPRFLRCSLGRILDARPWQVTWAWAAFLAAGGGGVASEGRRWAPRSQGPHGLSCTLTYHMMPSNCLWVARVGDTSLGGVPFT